MSDPRVNVPPYVTTALEYATREMVKVHDLLNGLEVPTHVNDQKLSTSQRVEVLVGAYKSACSRVGRVIS